MIKPKIKYFIVFILFFLFLSITPVFALEIHLTYDENGNLITGDGKYREYDEFNRLVRVRAGFNNVSRILEEYVYHPTEDRILAKKVYDFNQNLIETIVYVNDNLVRKINSTGTFDTVYVKDGQGIVAELQPNGKKIYYHGDHLGSTTLITNQSGGIVENTSYAPFGEILSGGNVSRFDYEGKEFSSGTGYGEGTQDYDFHFRKFDPGLKIFTKPESLFPNLYDPQQLNRYAFERNNPYVYVDRNGKAIIYFGAQGIVGAGPSGLASGGYYYSYAPSSGYKEGIFSQRGIGVSSPTASATQFIGFSPLSDYKDFGGKGTSININVGDALGVNVNFVFPINSKGKTEYSKFAIELGPSGDLNVPAPGSVSIFKTYTQTYNTGFGTSAIFNPIFMGLNGYVLYYSSSYQINQAQQVNGCNPSIQSCTPPQTSSGNTGGGNSGGDISWDKGYDDPNTQTCRLNPCADKFMCC